MHVARAAFAALLVLLSGLAAAASLPAGVARGPAMEGISEFTLQNGLRVLLLPDPSQDTITVNVTYLVGSRHEGYGESGMAHLLEHMLFKGTPSHRNIKNEFLKRGARYNGTTSYDRTNYFETFPASNENLAWALALEADRMVNSFVSKEDLESEMTVVRNEFESGENSPFGVLFQRMSATAYLWHNYGRAVIGSRSDIENVPIERLQAFYRRYYQPDNAVLVIAGKFDEAFALDEVARTFGRIPKPERILPGTYTREPTQDGERLVTLRRVGNIQLVAAMYHVPAGTHPDYAAVDVLTAILSAEPTGRLHKALVETGKASSSFGSERQKREAGAVYFGAAVAEDKPLEPAREALLATVEGFGAAPVTGEEVERARTQLLNDIEMLVTNTRSLAVVLSEPVALGDWRLLFWYRDRLRAVTREEVQRVALDYLKPANRTVGLFLPTAKPDRAEVPAAPDVAALLADYRGETAVDLGEAFNPTPENIEARVIRRTLPGGMQLALMPKKTRGGVVVGQLGLRWGTEEAKESRATACMLAGAMLSYGTEKRSRAELKDSLDRAKADVAVSGDGATLRTTRENLAETLRLVAEMLRRPSFPPEEFEQVKRAMLTGIDSQRTDPGALSRIEITRYLEPYPPSHWRYTPTIEESAARIRSTSLEEVKKCHTDFFGASNGELALVGDFDPDEAVRLAEELFGDWKSPAPYARVPDRFFEVGPIDRVIETPDKANAVFRAGLNLRLRDDDPDYPALVLGNYLLGGSSDARLARRIREKEGLSYSVGSWLSASALDRSGDFGAYAIYAPQNRARVETLVREEIRLALTEGFSHDEVEAAKKGLLQARQVARNQDASIAARLAAYLVIDRTYAWDAELDRKIAALSPDVVRDALRRHLDLDRITVVKAGDFNGARPAPKAAAAVK